LSPVSVGIARRGFQKAERQIVIGWGSVWTGGGVSSYITAKLQVDCKINGVKLGKIIRQNPK
jgi:hypothetical protein